MKEIWTVTVDAYKATIHEDVLMTSAEAESLARRLQKLLEADRIADFRIDVSHKQPLSYEEIARKIGA